MVGHGNVAEKQVVKPLMEPESVPIMSVVRRVVDKIRSRCQRRFAANGVCN